MLTIILATKWPILVYQCVMNHQKSTILWIFGTLSLSVQGCGGHRCYFQPNPRNTSQMSASYERTDTVFITGSAYFCPSDSNYFCQFTMRHPVAAISAIPLVWGLISTRSPGALTPMGSLVDSKTSSFSLSLISMVSLSCSRISTVGSLGLSYFPFIFLWVNLPRQGALVRKCRFSFIFNLHKS